MKIVDFRMKTEALETVRNPPFRELSKNYENNWPHICPRETEASYGHRQIHLCFSRWSLIDPGSPFALLQEEHDLSGHSPVNGDEHSAERRFTGCVYSKETGERKLSVLRFFLVGFVMLYEALSDCAKLPCLILSLGQSAHYTSTNRTVAVFTVHTVSIGTVYKESYMKNNINMFNL